MQNGTSGSAMPAMKDKAHANSAFHCFHVISMTVMTSTITQTESALVRRDSRQTLNDIPYTNGCHHGTDGLAPLPLSLNHRTAINKEIARNGRQSGSIKSQEGAQRMPIHMADIHAIAIDITVPYCLGANSSARRYNVFMVMAAQTTVSRKIPNDDPVSFHPSILNRKIMGPFWSQKSTYGTPPSAHILPVSSKMYWSEYQVSNNG